MMDFDKELKDEILSLRDELDSNDPSARKSAVRRVLNLMRSGENVGSLFSSMLRCVNTDDIQLKKLVYLYLVTYSSQESEQSIMAVNTFVQDSDDANPIIRALAVRTMCRIKLDAVAEYMVTPLKKRLGDKDPYVRKTAAIAVSKLYDVIPETVESSDIISDLQKLLYDENPMVVSNAAIALLEINDSRTTPIFVFDENNVSPILSATTQCNDWVQTMLLDALAKYNPPKSDEASFLIDRLVPFLKNANPAVVIGAFKCIYKFMEADSRSQKDIFNMILPPFLTLISSAEPEIQFVVLRTLSLFVMKYPHALQKDIRLFFCKYNDPCYIKIEKLNIIVTICHTLNVQVVIDELEEYCNDVDVAFVRKTIQCLGQIAMKVQVSARRCVDILVKVVESKADYAVEAAIEVFADLFRVFPGEFELVISKICQNIDHIKSSSAKAAAIWILGEYSQIIEKVDLILDPFLDTFIDESPDVQIQILTAIVKNYLNKQNQSKDQLQYLLEEATKENILPDVRNRALIYWRFLTLDTESAKSSIIFNKPDTITKLDERFEPTVLNELISNMGTVSGVLHILPDSFVKQHLYLPEDDDYRQDNFNNIESHEWHKATCFENGINNNDEAIDIFVDWSPSKLWVKVVNKIQQAIGQFAIALNKNCIGIEMEENPSFPAQLEYGESFEVGIPLKYSDQFVSNVESSWLQIALRTTLGTKIFAVPIDFTCVTQPFGDIGSEQFEVMWSQMPQEVTVIINNAVIADKETLYTRRIINVSNEVKNSNQKGQEIYLAFCLPPSYIYIAKLIQTNQQVHIIVRGDPSLFQVIRENVSKLLCNESNSLINF